MSVFDKAREKALARMKAEKEKEKNTIEKVSGEEEEETVSVEGSDNLETKEGSDAVELSESGGVLSDPPEAGEGALPEEAPADPAEEPSTPEKEGGDEASGSADAPLTEREQRFAREIINLRAQLEKTRAQISGVMEQTEQMSEAAEEAVEAAIGGARPVFDHAALRAMDEQEAKNYLSDYDRQLGDFYGAEAEKQYAPLVEEHERNRRLETRRDALRSLSASGELPGIEEYETQIMENLNEIPALSDDKDTASAVAAAYLIALGYEVINERKSPAEKKSPAEIVAEIEANPEVMRILEQNRVAALQKNEGVPAFTRRASVRSVPPEAPKNFREARENAKKRFSNL